MKPPGYETNPVKKMALESADSTDALAVIMQLGVAHYLMSEHFRGDRDLKAAIIALGGCQELRASAQAKRRWAFDPDCKTTAKEPAVAQGGMSRPRMARKSTPRRKAQKGRVWPRFIHPFKGKGNRCSECELPATHQIHQKGPK